MFRLPMYLSNAAPSTPIKRGSNGPGTEMCKKRQKKRKGKRKRKEENAGSNRKKNTQKNIHFPTVTPT